MKKYISTILIGSILIQLYGCYSQRTITYDEFYSLPKTEKARIKINNGDTFELDSDSLRYNYINWEKSVKGVTLYPTHREKYTLNKTILITDTVRYSEYDIEKIYIDELDKGKTISLVVISALIIGLIMITAINFVPQIDN